MDRGRRLFATGHDIPLSPAPSPVPSIRRLNFRPAPLSPEAQRTPEHLKKFVKVFAGFPKEEQVSFMKELLDTVPREVLVELQNLISPKLRHDPFTFLPTEICLRILSYIRDPQSLAAASQVSKRWYLLLSDDSTWKTLCETHQYRRLSAAGTRPALFTTESLKSKAMQASSVEIEDPSLIEATYDPEACAPRPPTSYRSHFRQQYLLSAAWRSGGRVAARYKLKHTNPAAIVTVVLMQDGYICVALDTSRVLIFQEDGRLLHSLYGHVMGVWALALSGNTLVTGGCDRDVREWDLTTGACRKILRGHTSTVRCLAMAGPSVAVSGGRDATVRVWDLARGRSSFRLAGHTGSVRRLEVIGNYIVSASYDCTARIWRLDTGELVHILAGHLNQIYSLAVNDKIVATGSMDHTVRLWDLHTGASLAVLQGHSALVGQLQLYGDKLLSGGSDGALRVWDTATYECLIRIAAHDNSITTMQFDSERIVSGGPDGYVHIWSSKTGEHIRQLNDRPLRNVWGIAFRHDRLCLVSAEDDGTVVELFSFVPNQ